MNGALKNNGMVALTGALGIASIVLATVAALGSVGDGAGPLQVATLLAAGFLVLGGLLAMHRGLRGGRVAVALGTIVPGALLVWTVFMPLVAFGILIWLFARRDPQRDPVPTVSGGTGPPAVPDASARSRRRTLRSGSGSSRP